MKWNNRIKNFDINGFAQKERIIIPPKEIVYAFKQIIETFYVKIQTNGIESEHWQKQEILFYQD